MPNISREQVEGVLQTWQDPYLGTDLISAHCIRDIGVADGHVSVEIELGFPASGYRQTLASQLQGRIEALAGVTQAEVSVRVEVLSHAVQRNLTPLMGVKNIIAIASGKGA